MRVFLFFGAAVMAALFSVSCDKATTKKTDADQMTGNDGIVTDEEFADDGLEIGDEDEPTNNEEPVNEEEPVLDDTPVPTDQSLPDEVTDEQPDESGDLEEEDNEVSDETPSFDGDQPPTTEGDVIVIPETDTPLPDADAPAPCSLDDSFLSTMPTSWNSYFTLKMSGVINDPNADPPTMASPRTVTAHLLGVSHDLSNSSGYYVLSAVQDTGGNTYPAIMEVSMGSLAWPVPGKLASLWASQTFVTVDDLLAWKQQAEGEGSTGATVDGVYQAVVFELWIEVSGLKQYLRMECVRGLSALKNDQTAYDGRMFVCIDQNTSWAIGETMRMMEYARMLDQKSDILAVLNEGLTPGDPDYRTDICTCYTKDVDANGNPTTTMDCEDMKDEFGLGELPDTDTVDTDTASNDEGQSDQTVPDEDSVATDETQPDDAADADEVLSDDDTITIPPCAFPPEWLDNRPLSWGSYLTFRMSGLINAADNNNPTEAEIAELVALLNGDLIDLADAFSAVVRDVVRMGDGNLYPAVISVNGGHAAWVVPLQLFSAFETNVFALTDDLIFAKSAAEAQGLSAAVFDGVYQLAVWERWYQFAGSTAPLRMECIRGLSALNSEQTAYDGALYVCVDENTDWSVGETLRMMEYVRMLDDETEMLAALNEGLAPEDPGYWTTLCFCYAADGTTPMDCDDMKAEFGL